MQKWTYCIPAIQLAQHLKRQIMVFSMLNCIKELRYCEMFYSIYTNIWYTFMGNCWKIEVIFNLINLFSFYLMTSKWYFRPILYDWWFWYTTIDMFCTNQIFWYDIVYPFTHFIDLKLVFSQLHYLLFYYTKFQNKNYC